MLPMRAKDGQGGGGKIAKSVYHTLRVSLWRRDREATDKHVFLFFASSSIGFRQRGKSGWEVRFRVQQQPHKFQTLIPKIHGVSCVDLPTSLIVKALLLPTTAMSASSSIKHSTKKKVKSDISVLVRCQLNIRMNVDQQESSSFTLG